MNTAAGLCRNLVRFKLRSWSRKHGIQNAQQLCKPTRLYTTRTPVIQTLVTEHQQSNGEQVELQRQIRSGTIVKTALGQRENRFEELLSSWTTVDEVLERVKTSDLSSSKRVKVFKRIKSICLDGENTLNEKQLKQIWEDTRFAALLSSVDVENDKFLDLVLLLENLLPLIGEDNKFLVTVGTKLQKQLSEIKYGVLMRLMTICGNHQETAFWRELYADVQFHVKRRWVETSDPSQLLTLIETLGSSSPTLYIKLQNKALSLTDKMNRDQLLELLKQLSRTKQRNIPLLKNISHHFLQHGVGKSVSDIRSLLYSVAMLNLYDEKLLRETTTTLYSNLHLLKKETPDALSGMLFSLTKLKYRYVELIDSIVGILMPEATDGSTEEQIVNNLPSEILTSLIVCCGTMNHMPERWTKGRILDVCVKKLQNDSELNPKIWLNTVYALVVLNAADKSSVSSVLSQAGRREWSNYTAFWKLHDIDLAAKYEMKSYKGPYLSEEISTWRKDKFPKTNVLSKRSLNSDIVKALEKSQLQNYFTADLQHPSGITIDIQMIVNAKGEPQEVENYQPGKKLPKSKHLVAVVALDYSDMTKCTAGPTDVKSLHMRHLKLQGYKVVPVPYTEWADLATTANRVEYLFRKIQDSAALKKAR